MIPGRDEDTPGQRNISKPLQICTLHTTLLLQTGQRSERLQKCIEIFLTADTDPLLDPVL